MAAEFEDVFVAVAVASALLGLLLMAADLWWQSRRPAAPESSDGTP